MAKRKPDPALAGQLDMFGDWQSSTPQQIPTTMHTPKTVEPANVDNAQIRQAPNLPSPANDVSGLANPATCHLSHETMDTTLVTCPMIQAESQNFMIPEQPLIVPLRRAPRPSAIDSDFGLPVPWCEFGKASVGPVGHDG